MRRKNTVNTAIMAIKILWQFSRRTAAKVARDLSLPELCRWLNHPIWPRTGAVREGHNPRHLPFVYITGRRDKVS